jgi:uncharacterized protein (TIGR02001 family)
MAETRKLIQTLGAASVALLALAGQASAGDLFGAREGSIKDEPAPAEARKFSYSINVGYATEYVFRGISLSNEDPMPFGGIDATYGIFYVGSWATGLDVGDFGSAEVDFYGGIKPVWGPVTFDFGVIYYSYPNDVTDLDYTELKAGASVSPVTNLSLGATLYYAPDQSNAPEIFTVEGAAAYTFPTVGRFTPTLSGVLGWSDADDFSAFGTAQDSYTYWNVGLALAIDKFTFDVRYWDTDGVGAGGWFDTDFGSGENSDSRVVGSVKVALP